MDKQLVTSQGNQANTANRLFSSNENERLIT